MGMDGTTMWLAGALVALALLPGCGSGAQSGTTADNKSSANSPTEPSAESTTAPASPYAVIAAQSANEKLAVSNASKVQKQNAENTRASNKQNNLNDYVFTNEESYEPEFIGYKVLLTGKRDNGKYTMFDAVVLGDKVTHYGAWEYAAQPTKDNGMLGEGLIGQEYPTDPMSYTKALKPESDSEKAAVEAATTWMAKNLDGGGYTDAVLTGYVIAYGRPGDRPHWLFAITPDGTMFTGIGSWPDGYKP